MWSKRTIASSLLHRLCIWENRSQDTMSVSVFVSVHVIWMLLSVTTTPRLAGCVSSAPGWSPWLSGAAGFPWRQSSAVSPCAPPLPSTRICQTYAGPLSYARTPLHTQTQTLSRGNRVTLHTIKSDATHYMLMSGSQHVTYGLIPFNMMTRVSQSKGLLQLCRERHLLATFEHYNILLCGLLLKPLT